MHIPFFKKEVCAFMFAQILYVIFPISSSW